MARIKRKNKNTPAKRMRKHGKQANPPTGNPLLLRVQGAMQERYRFISRLCKKLNSDPITVLEALEQIREEDEQAKQD